MHAEALHLVRLVAVESALLALLNEARQGEPEHDRPDGLRVVINAEGCDVEYLRGAVAVGGEGV